MYRRFGKRVFDIIVATVALVVLLPVFILTAILVKCGSRGPVFFVQDRLGRHGATFKLLKFRTMTHVQERARRDIFEGDPEVTLVGRWLRRFKIDELPQVINVLKGDMSVVGPRPARPEQREEYDERSVERLCVRPGLTGLAQINGNIYLEWSQRWEFDIQYVRNLSFWSDVMIIFKTFAVVLLGEKWGMGSQRESTINPDSEQNED